MRIPILYFILCIYIADQKCFVDCMSKSPEPVSPRQKTVDQFKQYMPLLDKSAEKYMQYEDLMLSAVDCLKFTLVFRFFSVWNILLMGIAYGLDQDIIKKTVNNIDTEKLKNRSTKIAKNALPKEVYEKMSNFVELAGSIEKSSANVSTALESVKTNLTSMLSSPIALAKFLSKVTVKDSARSLRSCFNVFARVMTDKELHQDFLDGVLYVRDGIYESSKFVRSVSKSTADYAASQIDQIKSASASTANYAASQIDQIKSASASTANYTVSQIDQNIKSASASTANFAASQIDQIKSASASTANFAASQIDQIKSASASTANFAASQIGQIKNASTSTANYAASQIGQIITKIGTFNSKEKKLDANEKEEIKKLDSMLKRTVENDKWQSQANFWAKKTGKSGKSLFTSSWSTIRNACTGKQSQSHEVEKN